LNGFPLAKVKPPYMRRAKKEKPGFLAWAEGSRRSSPVGFFACEELGTKLAFEYEKSE